MRGSVGPFVCLALLATAASVAAQDGPGMGIGPRVTFQAGEQAVPDSSVLRVLGGQVRMRLTPKTAVELSADYESSLDATLRERVKSLPVQASVMMFPVQSKVAPYVLGGIGWYRQSIANGGDTLAIRKVGYHAGVGAEVRVGRRVALHGDYRYTRLRIGDNPPAPGQPASSEVTASSIATALSLLSKLAALQESLKVSHQGSMWNWGMTFFF